MHNEVDIMQDMVEVSLEQISKLESEIKYARDYVRKFEAMKSVLALYYGVLPEDVIAFDVVPNKLMSGNYAAPIINVKFSEGCNPRSIEDAIAEDGAVDVKHGFVTLMLENREMFNYIWSEINCLYDIVTSVSKSVRDDPDTRSRALGKLVFDGAFFREMLSRAAMYTLNDHFSRNRKDMLLNRTVFHEQTVVPPRLFRLVEIEAPVFETF